MKKVEFRTSKTARVFTLGDLNTASEVWIILHGYAQLANSFLSDVDYLVQSNTAVIAPEGLHRFYRRGFYGDVVASWMTKEDRLDDIKDYVDYLNLVCDTTISEHQTINILGFSQGVATACRWVAHGHVQPRNVVLWAGTFPNDIDLNSGTKNIKESNVFLAFDENDVFRTEESWQKQLDFFKESGLNPVLFEYKGGHTVPKDHLLRLIETHINPSLSN